MQCLYCEMPKKALQGDRTSSQWQATCNNTCTGLVHPNITPARQVQDGNNCRVTPGMHNPSISAQTVRNRLREAGLRACRPVVRQALTRHYRQQRLLWAQTHRHWTRQDWQKVLFTDESHVCETCSVHFLVVESHVHTNIYTC